MVLDCRVVYLFYEWNSKLLINFQGIYESIIHLLIISLFSFNLNIFLNYFRCIQIIYILCNLNSLILYLYYMNNPYILICMDSCLNIIIIVNDITPILSPPSHVNTSPIPTQINYLTSHALMLLLHDEFLVFYEWIYINSQNPYIL